MKCPKCKTSGAYISVLFVECVNPDCEHYTEKRFYERVEEVQDEQFDEDESTNPYVTGFQQLWYKNKVLE